LFSLDFLETARKILKEIPLDLVIVTPSLRICEPGCLPTGGKIGHNSAYRDREGEIPAAAKTECTVVLGLLIMEIIIALGVNAATNALDYLTLKAEDHRTDLIWTGPRSSSDTEAFCKQHKAPAKL
jgi:hypothetical protein